ncbi:MAG: short-chain dehydrogenase/reductase [Pedosphaera sp.]|nr:short-chain dehydrogenase/reductase [Pedosphaera sp.]
MAKQKTALVTGANKGIGLEIARELAERGFHVFLSARKRDAGLKAAAMVQKQGAKADFVELDVSDPASVKRAAKEVAAAADHLDVLVNNAGMHEDGDGDVLTTDPKLVRETIETNALGPLRVTQAFWPLLAKSDAGRIINVSSGVGALHDMESYAPAYSISKTALNAVTRQSAAALKSKGVAVNSVTPGWVRTDMGGTGAPRSVQEGADSVVWLATEAPKDLTGQFVQDRRVIPW